MCHCLNYCCRLLYSRILVLWLGLFLSFLSRIRLSQSLFDFALEGFSFLGSLLQLILAFEVFLIVFTIALLYSKVRAGVITIFVESY